MNISGRPLLAFTVKQPPTSSTDHGGGKRRAVTASVRRSAPQRCRANCPAPACPARSSSAPLARTASPAARRRCRPPLMSPVSASGPISADPSSLRCAMTKAPPCAGFSVAQISPVQDGSALALLGLSRQALGAPGSVFRGGEPPSVLLWPFGHSAGGMAVKSLKTSMDSEAQSGRRNRLLTKNGPYSRPDSPIPQPKSKRFGKRLPRPLRGVRGRKGS